jgi:hypothetical protein
VATIGISGIHPHIRRFLRMNLGFSTIRPQKGLFLRTNLGFSAIHPQKGLFLRTNLGFSAICSFMILVDYLDVLSLGKVDSVYKLKLIIVDFKVLCQRFVYLPSLIPVKS